GSSVLLGNGLGAFSGPIPVLTGISAQGLVVADFNEDTKLDIAVGNRNGGAKNVVMVLGDGAGGFGPANSFPVGSDPRYMAFGDFNGDNHVDLAVPNFGDNNLSIL